MKILAAKHVLNKDVADEGEQTGLIADHITFSQ